MAQSIPIKDIIIEKRKLNLRTQTLEQLKASISELGLLQPPLVRRTDKGLKLVTGAHRVEACRQLKWEMIPVEIKTNKDDKWAGVAEIDENLMRRVPSRAERAKIVAQRHALTGHELKGHFASETAEKTGTSSKEIRRDLKRARTLGLETLNRIKGTSLDSGAEMDALGKLPKASAHRLISKAAKGEQVSAISAISGPKKNPILRAWERADDDTRRDFLAHLKRIKVAA
ncbi:MAG TPA: ParB/RepB/Spo0J family partition protein [Candidatus Cybelea sp.]|nr:ParB/RepB/Spo0J family partition protein [Candidatus Cybelea sp.]